MPVAAVDSSKDTSVDLKKQIAEQTKALEEATSPTAIPGDVEIEEKPETEETETTEQTEAETEETETSEEETTEEVETPKKKETLYKLKVEGKEEELPIDKVIEYAQKGRFYEREKQRLNEKERRIEEEKSKQPSPNQPQNVDLEKAKQEFFEAAQKDPFSTFGMMFKTFLSNEEDAKAEERKQDKAFEKDKRETAPEVWSEIKPTYEEYRDLGYSRNEAYLAAENDFLRSTLSVAKQKWVKESLAKAKAKLKAEIPTASTKTKVKSSMPSPEEFKKMKSSEMRKHLPRAAPRSDW